MMHYVKDFLSRTKFPGTVVFVGTLGVLFFTHSFSYAQIQTGSFGFEGQIRDYIAFLPNNYSNTSNSPVVLNLHGYGGNAGQIMTNTQMNLVADTSGFIVVYPNAIDNVWNSGIFDKPGWPTPNVNDVGFIDALIDTLNNRYSIDLERIYVCGMSNGGFMTYKLACQLSSRIAAVASVAGVLTTSTVANCTLQVPIPVLYIHGTEDPIVPYNGVAGWYSAEQTLAYWTDINACMEADTTYLSDIDPTDGCTVEKIRYTNCSNNYNVFFYKVINGGHTWPDAATNYGVINRDINANEEIWNFFKDYRLTPTYIESFAKDGILLDYDLFNNYPNPFNPITVISYQLWAVSQVELSIYNLLGQKVASLVNDKQQIGTYEVEWDASDFVSGIYFYRLQTDKGFVQTKKLCLLK